MIGTVLRYGWTAGIARLPRTLPYILAIAVGVGVVGATTGVASKASSAAQTTANRDGAGRILEVEPDILTTRGARLTEDTIERLRALRGVRQVLPASDVAIGIKTRDIPGVLFSATTLQTSRPELVKPRGKARPALRRGQALLPSKAQGSEFSALVGQKVRFDATRATGPGRGTGTELSLMVVGIYDASYQVDGRDVAYLSEQDLTRLAALRSGVPVRRYRSDIGFDSAQIVLASAGDTSRVMKQAQALGLAATSLAQQYAELPTVLELAQLLGRVLGVLLVLIVIALAASQTAISVRSRWTEVGLLRAIGAGPGGVALAFVTEAAVPTTIGVIVGALLSIPLGILTNNLLGDEVRFASSSIGAPDLLPVLAFGVLTLAAGMLGAAWAARRAATIDPSTVLRGA